MPTDMMHMHEMQLPEFYPYQRFFLITAIILYTIAALLYSGLTRGTARDIGKKTAQAFVIMAIMANFAICIIRWIAGDRLPLNNIFETLTFFALTTAVIFLILEAVYKLRDYGFYVMSIIVVSLCAVAFGPWFERERTSIPPSMPALNSYWLPIHVIITFIAYAGFAVAASAGVRYLILKLSYEGDEHKETLNTLDAIMYKITGISYVFLGAGIIFGSIWANEAWGGYWMWDPKEVWSLITWVFYTMYLHIRYKAQWGKTLYAALSVLGLICVIFTYICVSYARVFSGEHSFN